MTWVDFHMHTDASEDSDAPLRSMCDAAVAKGAVCRCRHRSPGDGGLRGLCRHAGQIVARQRRGRARVRRPAADRPGDRARRAAGRPEADRGHPGRLRFRLCFRFPAQAQQPGQGNQHRLLLLRLHRQGRRAGDGRVFRRGAGAGQLGAVPRAGPSDLPVPVHPRRRSGPPISAGGRTGSTRSCGSWPSRGWRWRSTPPACGSRAVPPIRPCPWCAGSASWAASSSPSARTPIGRRMWAPALNRRPPWPGKRASPTRPCSSVEKWNYCRWNNRQSRRAEACAAALFIEYTAWRRPWS